MGAAQLFHRWDTNHDGVVGEKEFERAVLHLGLTTRGADARLLFSQFDADGSGSITYHELRKILTKEEDATDIRKNPAQRTLCAGVAPTLGNRNAPRRNFIDIPSPVPRLLHAIAAGLALPEPGNHE